MTSLTPALARHAIDAKTKPLGALGRLEDIAVRLALLQNSLAPRAESARVCVFAADHGVTDEGVSAYPRAVTGEMMRNFSRGGAAINVIAAAHGIGVEVLDIGVDADLHGLPSIRHAPVRRGTRNLACEPAMSLAELDEAMLIGADAAARAAADGIQLLGLGEMGIGNTTSAATLLSLLSGEASGATVGRGTGIDDDGLARKRAVVDRAIALHGVAAQSGHEALQRVGGFEIAAMTGAALAAAPLGLAIVVDGFIASIAVLAALHIARADSSDRAARLASALFFAHRSAEHGHRIALDQCATFSGCDATPILDLGLRLGEGSGAALAIPVLRAAAAVMREMATFASAGVSESSPTAPQPG
jgi:nicotinate-nucleotide--dimethylbenzimidazole phosphoribosyltransferase